MALSLKNMAALIPVNNAGTLHVGFSPTRQSPLARKRESTARCSGVRRVSQRVGRGGPEHQNTSKHTISVHAAKEEGRGGTPSGASRSGGPEVHNAGRLGGSAIASKNGVSVCEGAYFFMGTRS